MCFQEGLRPENLATAFQSFPYEACLPAFTLVGDGVCLRGRVWGSHIHRLSGDAEHQVELRYGVLIFTCLGVGHILGIDIQERWAMENGKQRRPFLEENVDQLIG